VLAFRLARHHLHQRLPSGAAAAAAHVGLQDTPPGSAAVAFAARVDAPPVALDALPIVFSVRGTPMAVAPEDVPVFTVALDPPDEAAARTIIRTAVRTLEGMSAMEALDHVSAAVRDALADGPLPRDDLHQALRERLPAVLLPWCRGCQSHHVHPSLWRATGVRGILAVVGREGRSAVFGPPPEPPAPVGDPGAELARRFLRAYGPGRPVDFRLWAGIETNHAKHLFSRAGELAEAEMDGGDGWILAEDAEALAAPPPAKGARLLANLDPYLTPHMRELLVPDRALRSRIWPAIGGPGVVLAEGRLAGLWRPSKRGRRLVVTVEPLGGAVPAIGALAAEAERLAPFRGAESAEVAGLD
jgi:hypothetical protein